MRISIWELRDEDLLSIVNQKQNEEYRLQINFNERNKKLLQDILNSFPDLYKPFLSEQSSLPHYIEKVPYPLHYTLLVWRLENLYYRYIDRSYYD